MIRLLSMNHVDKRIRISLFLVLVLLVASESVEVEAANARVLQRKATKPKPSLAQPDYTVYHTKKAFKDAVQRLVDSCTALTMDMVSYAADDDPSYVANMSVVTFNNADRSASKSHGDDDDGRLHILLDFGEHGRELISSEVGLSFLTSLCDGAYRQSLISKYTLDDTIQDVLNAMVIHVIPMENEHGRDKVEEGNLCERKNGRGVDPNRNWPVDWGKKEPDYDPSEEYPGLRPFSEPEAVAVREIVATYNPDVFINIHSGMEALFVPYDHRKDIPYSESVNATLDRLKDLNTKFCNGSCSVGSGGANVGYLAHGTATDYIHQEMHVPITMTWEIYGDFSAAYEDCFRSFNPVDKAHVGTFVDRWVASVLYFLQTLPDHPSTRERFLQTSHQATSHEGPIIFDRKTIEGRSIIGGGGGGGGLGSAGMLCVFLFFFLLVYLCWNRARRRIPPIMRGLRRQSDTPNKGANPFYAV